MSSTLEDHTDKEEFAGFYFESDHLALRGNQDYGNLLRTIAVLEAQRSRVIQQMDELEITQKKYMDNPELLLRKIQQKEDIMPPNYSTAIKIPDLDYFEALVNKGLSTALKEYPDIAAPDSSKVRGRTVDESKPETYNQLWTCEEQRHLEELLVEYPAEEVEMRRYAKIARALGNRTPQQVSSRVQKYFQKLHDAGMPIPGRKPKNRRAGYMKPKHFYRPSTFFPAFNVPVQMPEDDVLLADVMSIPSPSPTRSSSTETAPASTSKYSELDGLAKQRKLEMLKAIRGEKLHTVEGYNPDPLAVKCEQCKTASISRTRWHCNTCCSAVNYCCDCLVQQLIECTFKHLLHDLEIEEEA